MSGFTSAANPITHSEGATKTAIAIRHVPNEGLGLLAQPLLDAGFEVRYHDAWTTPDPAASGAADASLLIVLGGPMGVPDGAAYPFLRYEIDLLKARIAADRPTLGVCLGAQLIATAMGARVYRGATFELGFAPVTLTAAGRTSCLVPLADAPHVLHWHGDTYELPSGATRLASSAAYLEQAFSLGPRILALQFHPEVDAAMLETWIETGDAELARARVDARALREGCSEVEHTLAPRAHAMLRDWLDGAMAAVDTRAARHA
jgi:GMP synthase (glutamine-hydrolysing)